MGSKEDIIASAREVMSQKGYSRTRISDITDGAGVAKGTFYLYFKSKEGILEELIRLIQDEQSGLLQTIENDISRMNSAQFTEGLELISSTFKEFYSKNTDILKILREELPHSSLVRYSSDIIRKNAKRVIVGFLEMGRESGFLKDMNYEILAEIVSLSLKEIIMNPPLQGSGYSVDEIFDQFIKTLMFGMLKEKAETQ